MKKVIAYFIDNPIFGNTILVVAAVFGYIAASTMNKESFPETVQDIVFVNVV